MYSIFFSVASADVAFAEQIWEEFPDDAVYLYSRTGEDGAHLWDEIAKQQLPSARLVVIFWSASYLKAPGCVRELEQTRRLIEQRGLRTLVLRLDATPHHWTEAYDDTVKSVFDNLGPALDHRTSGPNVTLDQAKALARRVAEPVLNLLHPMMNRPELAAALKSAAKVTPYRFAPAVWVSGFNGVGRKTLIRSVQRDFAPNGLGIVIDVNETSLPRPVFLQIESRVFGAGEEELRELQRRTIEDEAQAIAEAVERTAADGNYLIFRHDRIIEDVVELPDWIGDVARRLVAGTRPKLFVVSQMPLHASLRDRAGNALVQQRVPTVDEHNLTEFCWQLIGHFDSHPERWSEVEIAKLVAAAGGNLGFLIALVNATKGIEDFSQIDQVVTARRGDMATAITSYIRWAWAQLDNFEDAKRTLLFLNDVSPCDLEDLNTALAPTTPIRRVLGRLIDLGLVEREGEDLFRLTPLLSNRLNRELMTPELVSWQREALMAFAASSRG